MIRYKGNKSLSILVTSMKIISGALIMKEQTAVSVAEKPESVPECIAVDILPGVAKISGDQQQKGTSGLVKVGDHSMDDPEPVSGHYHQLRDSGKLCQS